MKYSPSLLAFVTIILTVSATLLLLEAGLQLLPVRSTIPAENVTAESPVLHYRGDRMQTYSAGWDFDAFNKSRVNKQGFLSAFDYEADDPRPLIAVVGDSFIEARMIPFEKTLHERIHEKLNDEIRVYNFATGGSPLSQYLIYAKHAQDIYGADFLIINIVSNDFDESLPQYKNIPRFHYFTETKDGGLKPDLTGDYRPSFIRNMVAGSALVRYLHFNLGLQNTVNDLMFSLRNKGKEHVPAAPVKEEENKNKKIKSSEEAVDAFLKLLPEYSGLSKDKILLVIDGLRFPIYNSSIEKAQGSYFAKMRRYTIDKARAAGYEIIDLQPVFEQDFTANGQKFEFEKDGHWNSYAHGLVANEILKSRHFQGFTNP